MWSGRLAPGFSTNPSGNSPGSGGSASGLSSSELWTLRDGEEEEAGGKMAARRVRRAVRSGRKKGGWVGFAGGAFSLCLGLKECAQVGGALWYMHPTTLERKSSRAHQIARAHQFGETK